jgi:hypothetical protein
MNAQMHHSHTHIDFIFHFYLYLYLYFYFYLLHKVYIQQGNPTSSDKPKHSLERM